MTRRIAFYPLAPDWRGRGRASFGCAGLHPLDMEWSDQRLFFASIHELFVKRWSPYAFSDRPVPKEDLRALFEAARWSASNYNEQPWRYIVAPREDLEGFERLLSCLDESNQPWAKSAPVLALGCAALKFARNGQPNTTAEHDLGAASTYLSMEATNRGLFVHQMAGILPDRAREVYQISDGFRPLTGLAIGYVGSPNSLPDDYKERDLGPRQRKSLAEFVFGGRWGTTRHREVISTQWRLAEARALRPSPSAATNSISPPLGIP